MGRSGSALEHRFSQLVRINLLVITFGWMGFSHSEDFGSPTIELIGVAQVEGTARDLSGLTEKLEDGSPADQFGGLSAIEYSGSGDRFILLGDRGAGDGQVTYPCRFHEADLVVNSQTGHINLKLAATRRLTSASGKQLVGSLAASDEDLRSPNKNDWTAMDPEGMRRLADGALIVCDEYGPHIATVDTLGHIIGEMNVPEPLRLHEPKGGVYEEGIYPNRGLEGIAVTPSGKRIVAALQSPLVQDARMNGYKCQGLNVRFLVLSGDGEFDREVVYRLENLSTCISEVLAIDEERFLVLERDSDFGPDAKIKQVFLIDIRQADDVTSFGSLPYTDAPSGARPLQKVLWLDLLDPRFGLGGDLAAEKPEGLCWGKSLPDGRRTLWVCCDNDFEPARKTEVYCFAVSAQ